MGRTPAATGPAATGRARARDASAGSARSFPHRLPGAGTRPDQTCPTPDCCSRLAAAAILADRHQPGSALRPSGGERAPPIGFGVGRDLCQDIQVAPAGRRGAPHHLTAESCLRMDQWSPCAAAPLTSTAVHPGRVRCQGDPISPTNRRAPPSKSSTTCAECRAKRATRPTAGVERGGGETGGTASPGGRVENRPARGTTGRPGGTRSIRTRETYGGTEDPHQAQGL